MDISKIHAPPGVDFPRISPRGFIAAIFAFLTIAIIGTFVRVGLRIFKMRMFGGDDAFLLLSLASLTATCVLNEQLGDILYIQIFASLHVIPFPAHAPGLLRDHQMLQAASFLGWVSIFSAKFSLLLFFRRVVYRVVPLETMWKVVVGIVIVFACITTPLGFIVCTDFSATFLLTCPASLIDQRERPYTIVSAVFDVLSDFLILTIPAGLLWIVKIDLRKKVALASMLFLSVFSIAIAIARAGGSLLLGGVTDTVWLFFWQTMEAAVGIIMVALTGFRSLFRTDLYTQRKSRPSYGSEHPLRTRNHGGNSSKQFHHKTINSQKSGQSAAQSLSSLAHNNNRRQGSESSV